VQGPVKRAVHRIDCMHALDLLRYSFWRNQVHGNVNPADHQDAIFLLHLSGYEATYVTEQERTTWFKIKNRHYSQMEGREELFERERHKGPTPGWHCCDVACAELEGAQ
jgi:hypothetical protein